MKTFVVEVKTQKDQLAGWVVFGEFNAKTKGDAVKIARHHSFRNMCHDRITDGKVWFRAIETNEAKS